MDGAAYLRKHGWQGAGFSLNPGNSRALKKPLLVSRKVDVLGVGLNKNDSVSDQWWLRAFDSSLKALGTGVKSALSQVREHGVARGGLYGRFVKGQDIPGTLTDRTDRSPETPATQLKPSETVLDSTITSKGTMGSKRKREDPSASKAAKRTKLDALASGQLHETEPPSQMALSNEHSNGQGAATRNSAVADSKTETSKPAKVKQLSKAALKKKAKREAALQRKAAKEEPRQDRVKKLRKSQTSAVATDGNQDSSMGFEQNSDFISFDCKTSSTHTQDREAKLSAIAKERGIALEAIKAEHDRDEEFARSMDEQAADEARAAQLGIHVKIYRELPPSSWLDKKYMAAQAQNLDADKRASYEKRATEKGQHFMVYFMARCIKNDKARRDRAATKEAGRSDGNTLAFMVDSTGDSSLATQPKLEHELLRRKKADLGLPATQVWDMIDTSLWKDKQVKELPKEVRELRRIWMRTRRRLRDEQRVAASIPGSKEAHKINARLQFAGGLKTESKRNKQEKLALAVLEYSRRVKVDGGEDAVGPAPIGPGGETFPVLNVQEERGQFTAMELKLARGAARKMMKREKELKKRSAKNKKPKPIKLSPALRRKKVTERGGGPRSKRLAMKAAKAAAAAAAA